MKKKIINNFWNKNLKWATTHLSIGWAGRRARGTVRAQARARHGRWGGRQAGAGERACRRAGRSGVAGARGARAAGKLRRARPGVLLGQLAVHSVHATCFWLGLTRYFSGVKFLDIVRESGS